MTYDISYMDGTNNEVDYLKDASAVFIVEENSSGIIPIDQFTKLKPKGNYNVESLKDIGYEEEENDDIVDTIPADALEKLKKGTLWD